MSHRTINLDQAELIGHIGVDSGQMMLVDPCYLDSWSTDDEFAFDASSRDEPENTDFSYAGACNVTLSRKLAATLEQGTAAVCATGFGDGQYPVYVEFSDEGSWGRRVKSMTIVFIGDDEDEECANCGDRNHYIGHDGPCETCAIDQAEEEE